MPATLKALEEFANEGAHYSYDERDTIMYALGLGLASDPLDARELDFVYEKNLKTFPTQAAVISWGANDTRSTGIDYPKLLHAGQHITLHRPIPPKAEIIANARVEAVADKGKDKGSIIMSVTDVFLKDDGQPLCTLKNTLFARGDGGISEAGRSGFGTLPVPHLLPTRKPDYLSELATASNQAIIYRLSGDLNPLHADPEVARAAGFERPILHGLCTFGVCCRAIVKEICDYQTEQIKSLDVRFTSVVYPGETLLIEMWRDGDVVSFRAKVRERDTLVIDNGKCVLG